MKLKLSITIYPESKRKAVTTGTFQADGRSLAGELEKLDRSSECGETTNSAVACIRSQPPEWFRDFLRSI